MKLLSLMLVLLFFSCEKKIEKPIEKLELKSDVYESIFLKNKKFLANGFIYPVGKDGKGTGYYVAQGFKKQNKRFNNNYHLGEDWNGNGGGDTDYGDPVLSIANGIVSSSGYEGPGWGNVIRIVHGILQNNKIVLVESVYGHVKDVYVKEGDFIPIGQKIATIGNANGVYYAHLHLELRTDIEMDLGGGYADDTYGFVDPRDFIKKNKDLKIATN
jgi:murein DD-endopeptidase MepM/ murein hydrolase activator NlpD